MIPNRSQTAPCSRNDSKAQKTSRTRISQSNTTNKISFSPSIAFPRNISTPEASGKNNRRLHKRATSAPAVSRPNYSSCILETRGKYYEQNGKPFDMMSYLKSKSFPRRIHRLINEIPNKTSENKTDEDKSDPVADDNETGDVSSASQIGLNNKQLLERRRGLHRRRFMNRSGVSACIVKLQTLGLVNGFYQTI
jgi:hypothetical protein